MKLLRRYNTLVACTALIASLAYCVADIEVGTLPLAALALVACLGAWWTSRGERPWALPRLAVNALMLAAIIDVLLKVTSRNTLSGFWTGAANTPIVSTLSQFLIYILLIKLFDRRTARDEAHTLSLSTFVVVGAVLTSNALGVGLLVLLFAPCVICAAMLLQLVGGARAAQDAARADHIPPAAVDFVTPSSPRRFRRDFAGAATLAVLGTLALATLCFIIMPRGLFRNVLGGFGRVRDSAQVGFTDQVALGKNNNIYNNPDESPVLAVKLTDASANPLGELRGTLYLRGVVKAHYDPRSFTWTEPQRAPDRDREFGTSSRDDLSEVRGRRDNAGGRLVYTTGPDTPLRLADRERAQILVRQEVRVLRKIPPPGYLFTIWRPLELRTGSRVYIDPPERDMILRAAGAGDLQSYTVVSAFEYSDEREPDRPDVSFDSPVVRDLAERVLRERDVPLDPAQRDAATNRRVAQAIVDHLRTSYTYSREGLLAEPGEDPIEMFLTRTRQGHCEYFASAMVAMCQSVGLDARLVAGYLATDFNRTTGEYTVRQNNAHAWAEVRIAPGRWQTFDPSPPDDIAAIHRPRAGLLARFRQWYDAINITWSSAVISFDGRKQQQLVGSSDRWRNLGDRVAAFFSSLRAQFSGVSGLLRVALIVLLLGAAAWTASRLLRRLGRTPRRARAAAPVAPLDPHLTALLQQVGFYEQALAMLDRADLGKPLYRPPLAHAVTIPTADAPARDSLARLAHLYYTVRFGRRPLSDAETAEAADTLQGLSAYLQRRAEARIAQARNADLPGAR